ncbi:MAG TPA: glutathione transferase GstA [Alphaproteobacteria bacterium]|nr:glutathione transferase GstA [Alphaproteobacteria bacterium]
MKLYYSPGACSLSPHIALCEAGLKHEMVKVDLRAKKTEADADFGSINPKGYVPTLELDDGSILTEGPAIVQYIADKAPTSNLAPANGSMERYRLQEWLTFIGTELHKQFSNLFNPNMPDAVKAATKEKISGRFALIEKKLGSQDYLMGKTFTVADGYMFVVMRWAKKFEVALPASLQKYFDRVAARPAVQEALKMEGLA